MGMGGSKGGNLFFQRWFEGSCATCLHIDVEPHLLTRRNFLTLIRHTGMPKVDTFFICAYDLRRDGDMLTQ